MKDDSKKSEELNQISPKFAESMVEIMDIINSKGGIDEVMKEKDSKRKFTSGKITFSEMDNKKNKAKKIVNE